MTELRWYKDTTEDCTVATRINMRLSTWIWKPRSLGRWR